MKTMSRILGAALMIGVVATTAFAGGPNYVYDGATKKPYRWHMETWPGGAVPVYHDLGGLGLMNNAMATDWVVRAWDQWNSVPTSTFRAQVVGSVAQLGLNDITPANVAQVYPGHFNGGGITVVYDYDGKIFRDYLGLGLNQVLGIAFHEFYAADSDEILEGTVFLNGYMQWYNDTDGRAYSGILTHEFGHSANLSHSQVNGHVYNTATKEYPWPNACPSGPYAGGAGVGPTRQQIETMYPFLNHQITGTSEFQFTPDKDDIAALSDLYPAPGWPESHGTIKGTVRSLTKILGNGSGPTQEVGGVHLVARNLADPYNDAVSITTGDLTRGALGPDGTFEIHGLTPDAQYALYIDNHARGGFNYRPLVVLPGPEEWYNADLESGNGEMDDRCAWTPITVAAQTARTADITFNRVKGQPNISILPFNGNPSSMSADGSAVVGTDANLVGYWMWTASGGYREIGGFAPAGGYPGISDDGSKVSGTVRDTDGILKWGLYDVAAQTWTVLPPSPGTPTSPTCFVAVNGFGNFPSYGLPWGISGDGSTVVGSSYQDRASSGTCRMSRAAKWTAATGTVILPKAAPSTTTNSSRANWASYDGSVIAGFDDAPSRGGAYWVNGVEHLLGGQTAANYVGESVFVTRDGSTVTGGTGNGNALAGAYKHYTTNDQTEIVHVGTEPFLTSSSVWRTNDSGNVVAGFDKYSNLFDSKLWTPEVGWVGVQAFLNAQGTYFEGGTIANIQALSGDGRTWAVLGATSYGTTPLLVEIPKAIVCHKSPGGQNTTTHNLDVTFPDGLEDHLAHGDTLGLCEHGGE